MCEGIAKWGQPHVESSPRCLLRARPHSKIKEVIVHFQISLSIKQIHELLLNVATVRAGDCAFNVGTAGSCTLVLQTVLPALMQCAEPSRLSLGGGTHNPMAPPFHFLERSFAPLPRRAQTLDMLGLLPLAPVATANELMAFIERHRLFARGIGYVDVHILASAALADDTRLWTRDRRLAEAATALGRLHRDQLH